MNVGVIGSGFIVPVFISETRRYKKDYHLRAIWGRHMDKLVKFANDFDYVTTDIDEMLNDKLIDVVYIALPNGLHYEYALSALKHNKHVILEKPFTVKYKEAKQLINLAKKKELIIFEAITTQHNPNYLKTKKLLDKIGDIKIVNANFSQYSRRYLRFKNKENVPVFDYKLAGGALLDLNVYNIRFVCGLFGKPKKVQYYPNIIRNVDTSGVLILDYGNFKVTSIAAKDSSSISSVTIEGDKGYIRCNTTASRCGNFTFKLNNEEPVDYGNEDSEFAGWKYELKEFRDIYRKKDMKKADELNAITLLEIDIIEKAIKSANLKY